MKGRRSRTRYQRNTHGPVSGQRCGLNNFRGDFTGNGFVVLLLGIPYSASRVVGKGVETGRSLWHGYYFQDDWKATRKLTFNFGLRYEYVRPLLAILNPPSTFCPPSTTSHTPLPTHVIASPTPPAN